MDSPKKISLSYLKNLSSRINSAENINTLLMLIINSAKELIQCESTSLLLLDSKSNALKFHIISDMLDHKLKDQSIPVGTGIAGLVAQNGHPILSNEAQNDERVYQEVDKVTHKTTKNLICVPMKIRDKMMGVIEAINSTRGVFDENDVKLLTFIASEAANAMYNRILFNRLKKANKELNSRIKELKYLYELSLLSSEYPDIYEQFHLVIQGTAKILSVNKASLMLYDKDKVNLQIVSSLGINIDLHKLQNIENDDGIVQIVIKNRMPLLVSDLDKEPNLSRYLKKTYQSKSFLIVPIIVEGEAIGVINMTDKDNAQQFSSSDLQFLTSVTSYIAKIYRNHFLKEEIAEQRRLKKEMEIASVLQNSFLPKKIPDFNGLEIGIYNHSTYEISGDFYDIIKIDENKIAITMCQVSGSGVPAALAIALFKNMLRGHIRQNASPKLVLNWINQQFYKDATSEMTTQAIYAIFDTHNRVVTYSSCGQNVHLMAYHKNINSISVKPSQENLLGESDLIIYDEYMFQYDLEDYIFCWTENKNNYFYQSLENTILNNDFENPQQIINHLQSNKKFKPSINNNTSVVQNFLALKSC